MDTSKAVAQATKDCGDEILIPYQADLIGNIRQILAGLKGYETMALELIQNADDAKATSLRIDIDSVGLRVSNNSAFSSCGMHGPVCPVFEDTGRRCDFHAISTVGSSNKMREADQIGRFGIGFVSVYQICDAPIIRSSSVELELNPLTGLNTVRPSAGADGTRFELPWVKILTPTRRALGSSAVPRNVAELVEQAFLDVAGRGMIFLRHLKTLEVFRSGGLKAKITIDRGGDRVHVGFGGYRSDEDWLVLTGDAQGAAAELHKTYPELGDLQRKTEFSIAFPLGNGENEGKLYAFLPTEQASRLPAHVNADFFPHQDRRSITLIGHGHDRAWNEMLLSAAADLIADHLVILCNTLGPAGIWRVLYKAYAAAVDGRESAFAVFWDKIKPKAAVAPVVLTASGERHAPAECRQSSVTLTQHDEAALSEIGIRLVASELRFAHAPLSTLGVGPLRLSHVAEALLSEEAALLGDGADAQKLGPLWSAVDCLIAGLGANEPGAIDELRKAVFLVDASGRSAAPITLFRAPAATAPAHIAAAFPPVRFAHAELEAFATLYAIIPEFDASAAATILAETVHTPDDAKSFIGADSARQREFYDLLARLPNTDSAYLEEALSQVPFLRSQNTFVSPQKALLPGGFHEPTGSFRILDTDALSSVARSFVGDVLGVSVLSFADYVTLHLPRILEGELRPEQYRSLIDELIRHLPSIQGDLEEAMRPLPLARTKAGTYVCATAVHRWTKELEAVLGDEPSKWLDIGSLPKGQFDLSLALFARLGMQSTPSAHVLVSRITELVEAGEPTVQSRTSLNKVMSFVLERFPHAGQAEREEYAELRDMEWLPAISCGEPDFDAWYSPDQLYRFFRSEAFQSQVAVVDLPAFRSAPTAAAEFMEFLGIPREPETDVVVSHLELCMEEGTEPKDTVYQILSERLGEDSAAIARLRDAPFIYNARDKRYMSADQVFWERPPLSRYWNRASERMQAMAKLFRFLGVRDEPECDDYLRLLRAIAERYAAGGEPDHADIMAHEIALARVGEALPENPDLREEICALDSAPYLITRAGGFCFVDEVAWLDNEGTYWPFDGQLDPHVIGRPDVSDATRVFFEAAGVRRLSDRVISKIKRVGRTQEVPDASLELDKRLGLLQWLAPTTDSRLRLKAALSNARLLLTDELQLVSEYATGDDRVTSRVREASAFFDADEKTLYIVGADGSEIPWVPAFRTLFADIFSGSSNINVSSLAVTASAIMQAEKLDAAEALLMSAGFSRPTDIFETAADEAEDLPNFDAGEAFDESFTESEPTSKESELEKKTDRDEDDEDELDSEAGDSDASLDGQDDPPGDGRSKGDVNNNANTGGTRSSGIGGGGGGKPTDPTRGEERPRRSVESKRNEWMRSYVLPKGREAASGTSRKSFDGSEIDEAAMQAVLKYESSRGRAPQRKSHSNPGYDILSIGDLPSDTRYIEVKGLQNEWNERGVKLSPVQFSTAQERGDRFWLYVVERATDPENRKIHAICNPFASVNEYRFDGGWLEMTDEAISGREAAAQPGASVRHPQFGPGEILRVDKKAYRTNVVVKFKEGSTKFLDLKHLTIVD